MREIETDYLVVGAGASGMAFADALVALADAEVLLVDRRHRPGGHWLDAYPFVRLHQPSAYYGVASRRLGDDRIDTDGPDAGFYERASSAEICDYFGRVLDEGLLPTGQVRFEAMSDHRGGDGDGHRIVSLLTGEETTVKVRRAVVDATYTESSIPSRHTPQFAVDDGVRFVAPNDLVELAEAAPRYTVIGAGKTAMDTCGWLLEIGVPPDRIRWIRSRDGWFFDRAFMQPLDLVGSFMQTQARWTEAAAAAESADDFARRLEAEGIFLRIDPGIEPGAFRGATISTREVDGLRSIDGVVRQGRVKHVGTDRITFEDGELPVERGEVHVDCTAAGVRPVPLRPVFEPGRITLQYVTVGVVPWAAATIGAVEAMRDDDDVEKNRLCPPLSFTGHIADVLELARVGFTGLMARAAEPDLNAWNDACRLNPARGVADHLDDPVVAAAFGALVSNIGPAMANLDRVLAPR